jgi:uncharacterized protein YutD
MTGTHYLHTFYLHANQRIEKSYYLSILDFYVLNIISFGTNYAISFVKVHAEAQSIKRLPSARIVCL